MQIHSRLTSASLAGLSLAALLFAASSFAAGSTTLTGAQETPAVDTKASGTSMIAIAADRMVTGGVETTGIEGTAAHIHVGAMGKSGPPIVTLEKAGANRWNVPAHTQLSEEQYKQFKAGELYVNVHSAMHKAGEIRVQLTP